MGTKTAFEKFTHMTAEQLAKATAKYDEEFAADTFRPPTAEERKKWEKAKRKRGRPTIGKGVVVVSVSLEKDLLARTDRLAKKLRISRAKLISRGLETVLDAEAT